MKNGMLAVIRYRLLYAILFLIPTQLSYHFWPEWAYVLGRRVDYLSPTVYLTDILIICYLFLGSKKLFQNLKQLALRFPVRLLAVIVLFAAWSVTTSSFPVTVIYLFRLFLYFLFVLRISSGAVIPFPAYIYGTVVSSFVGLMQTITGGSLGGIFRFLGERTFNTSTPGISLQELCLPGRGCFEYLRPYGTTAHPNVLAGFISLALVYLIIFGTSKKFSRPSSKILLLPVPGFLLVVLLLTGSAAALFASALALAWFVRRNQKTVMNPRNITTVFLIFIFSGLFLVAASADIRRQSPSLTERLVQSETAFFIFLRQPFFGAGPGAYLTQLPGMSRLRSPGFLQPVHNVWLLLLAETGFSGFLFFLFLIFIYLGTVFRSRLFPLLVAIGVISFFDHFFLTIPPAQLFLLVLLAMVHRTQDAKLPGFGIQC